MATPMQTPMTAIPPTTAPMMMPVGSRNLGEGGKSGGEGGGEGGEGGRAQVETMPLTPVRVVAQEQTVPPDT